MTIVAALSKYCRMDDETSTEFMQELKKLTKEDKDRYKELFKIEGIEVE